MSRGGYNIQRICAEIRADEENKKEGTWAPVHRRWRRMPLPRMKCASCGLDLVVEPGFGLFRCPVCRAVSFPCSRCRHEGKCDGPSECPLRGTDCEEATWSRKETR